MVDAQAAGNVLFLIKPVFETSTLGAKISVDERVELYSMLSEGCSGVFTTTVKTVSPLALDEVKEKRADFLIWDLKHYHFLYSDDEYEACLRATVYRFSASNNYAYPIFAATPPTVVGDESNGDLAPFREGIGSYFSELRRYLRKNKTGDAIIPKISPDDILKNDPFRDAASKVYVLVSPLTESTIGSTPMDYEIFHLPGMVAHYVGILVNKSSVVIDEATAARLKEQAIGAKVARVELHNYGNGHNVLGLSLYQSPDLDNPVFQISLKDPKGEGWHMNEEFQKGLEFIFAIIAQQMGSTTSAGGQKK